jgi:hypothetical protein
VIGDVAVAPALNAVEVEDLGLLERKLCEGLAKLLGKLRLLGALSRRRQMI